MGNNTIIGGTIQKRSDEFLNKVSYLAQNSVY